MQKFRSISLFILIAMGFCATHALGDSVNQAQICYLPEYSQVRYSQVTSLAKGAPTKVISYGSQSDQIAELWLPAESNGPAPLVIFVHGGCWLNEYNIQHSHAFSTALAKSGYAVWSIEYRREGNSENGWPVGLLDILLAIDFVSTLDQQLVDRNQSVLLGHSLGGYLALLAGAQRTHLIQAVVGLAAITDLQDYAKGDTNCQQAARQLMLGGSQQENATAMRRLHRNTILMHGDADKIVPITHADLEKTKKEVIAGAGHFDFIHPGSPAFQQLLTRLAKLYP